MGGFVNKLVVDRADAFSRKRKIIHFLRYTGDQLARRDMRKFIEIVYRNFEELNDKDELKHNRREIARLITSPEAFVIIATYEGNIIAYLIAESTIFNLRKLMHIHYIFTSPVYRGHGIATYMLNLIQTYTQDENINSLSLTFDTYNKSLEKFYFDNYFEYDPEIRSYQRHDMLVKHI